MPPEHLEPPSPPPYARVFRNNSRPAGGFDVPLLPGYYVRNDQPGRPWSYWDGATWIAPRRGPRLNWRRSLVVVAVLVITMFSVWILDRIV